MINEPLWYYWGWRHCRWKWPRIVRDEGAVFELGPLQVIVTFDAYSPASGT